MNQNHVKKTNLKKIRKCVERASSGVRTVEVVRRTRLCLRTVQSHLRTLRDEGVIMNNNGRWYGLA